jgi:broad specificity phosphatase PhoE
MKTIYLIRHVESEYNLAQSQGLIFNQRDVDLTLRGERQAQELAQKLPHLKFDLILVSPLKRAQRTYELSGLKTQSMMTLPLIRECRTDLCDFFEGEEVMLETDAEISDRVTAIKDYLRKLPESIHLIALVTHADLIWHLTSVQPTGEGESYGEWLENAEYTIIQV